MKKVKLRFLVYVPVGLDITREIVFPLKEVGNLLLNFGEHSSTLRIKGR